MWTPLFHWHFHDEDKEIISLGDYFGKYIGNYYPQESADEYIR